MQVVRKDGTHSLEGFKAFTKNHTEGKHTFTLASEGSPCDDTGTQMIVEISNEEVDMFIEFIEAKMFKDIEVVEIRKDEVVTLTDEMRDGFDFKVGQIIVLGCSVVDGGANEFELPVIVTKVHDRDINGHYQYDFIFPLRGACEFVSWGKDEKRYLWRFHRKEVLNPPSWFLNLFKDIKAMFTLGDCDLTLDELFYIDKDVLNKEDMFTNYPFRKDNI